MHTFQPRLRGASALALTAAFPLAALSLPARAVEVAPVAFARPEPHVLAKKTAKSLRAAPTSRGTADRRVTRTAGDARPAGSARGVSAGQPAAGTPAPTATQPAAAGPVIPAGITAGVREGGGSLTVPSVAEQRRTLQRTVGSVGYVDAAAPNIQTRVQQNLRDALEDSPGVLTQSRYGQELRVSIRGSSISRAYHLRGIDLLQDGIPFNLADGSGDYYQIDPLAFRSVEVFKGGNALAFGTTTLGGAIDFISPTAQTALAPNIVRLEAGSFGTLRANVQQSRVVGDKDYLVNATISHFDGYRDHERGNYQQINGNIGYRIGPGIETRFYWGVYNIEQLLPGTLTIADALTNPKKASASALSGNQARNVLAERVANRTTVAFSFGRLDVDSWAIGKTLNHPIFQVLDQDGFTLGLAPRLTMNFDVAGHRDELIVGSRLFAGRNFADQFVNNAGVEGTQTLNSRQDAFNAEAFAENRYYVLPKVAVMTGAKIYSDTRSYVDFGGLAADPTAKSPSKTYQGAVPKVGVIWFPKPDVQVFADVTGSRDVPDFTDLTQSTATTTRFTPLAQQRALTGEIGTRGRWERFTWDVTLYRSQLHDELLQFTTSQSIPASTFNAPRTLHQGVEFGAGVDILRNVTGPDAGDVVNLAQVYTYNDFRFQRDPVYGSNVIAGAPPHVLRTTLSYRRPDGLYVAPAVDWVPQGAFLDYANTTKVPGYLLVGLQAGIDLPVRDGPLPGKLSLYFDARNLADRRYVSDFGTITDARTAATDVVYPGSGRAFYAGARYAF